MINYIIIGILVILLGVLGYTTLNLLRKNETAEDLIIGYLGYLERLSQVIELTDEKLKKLDNKGSFKSDDEIGFFFNQVMELQKILNEFNIKTLEKDGPNNSQTQS
tara:strand:+ start:130 stop:447 length:318 start_codon:yes stop_codon:yes gene_type:complete